MYCYCPMMFSIWNCLELMILYVSEIENDVECVFLLSDKPKKNMAVINDLKKTVYLVIWTD